jgi:hypothetical protein
VSTWFAGRISAATPPAITSQRTSPVVTQGNSGSFSVAASGDAPLTYQWRHNEADIIGKTNNVLVLSNVQISDAGFYAATVSNEGGSVISSNAQLRVLLPPVILRIIPGPTGHAVIFTTVVGLTYALEKTETLTEPLWIPVDGRAGTGDEVAIVDPWLMSRPNFIVFAWSS